MLGSDARGFPVFFGDLPRIASHDLTAVSSHGSGVFSGSRMLQLVARRGCGGMGGGGGRGSLRAPAEDCG